MSAYEYHTQKTVFRISDYGNQIFASAIIRSEVGIDDKHGSIAGLRMAVKCQAGMNSVGTECREL